MHFCVVVYIHKKILQFYSLKWQILTSLLIKIMLYLCLKVFIFYLQSKKGKTTTTHRELTVVMPNGQNILVKCEVKSRGVDVFDMIVAHSNLIEHFYFGLAYIDGTLVC